MSLTAYLVAGLFLIGSGFIGGAKFVHAQWNAAKLEQAEVNQEAQRLAQRGSAKVTDVFNAKTNAANASALAARDELNRVRNALANQIRPADPACSADAERIASLSRLLDAGAGLVEEGRRRVDQLDSKVSGLQTYVREVCGVPVP